MTRLIFLPLKLSNAIVTTLLRFLPLILLLVDFLPCTLTFARFKRILMTCATCSPKSNLICLSETRLKDSTDFRLVNLPSNKIVAKNSTTKAGGVAMYISKTLEYDVIQNYSIDHVDSEDLWIKLHFNSSETLLVCGFYRHPKLNFNDFANKIHISLSKVSADNLNCVLLGDANIDLKKTNTCNKTRSHSNMLSSNSFLV